jgi:endonuclease-8
LPEGPEIHREAQRLNAALAGRPAVDVYFGFAQLKRWEDELRTAVVESVTAHGKALLTRFSSGPIVYSHNQLYGVWHLGEPGVTPETGRILRFAVLSDDAWALLYSASDVGVLQPEEVAQHPYLRRLGPDVCAASTTIDDALAQLEHKRFVNKPLGALLLDQSFLAGVGNYLRAEILYVARLSPTTKPRDMDPFNKRALAQAALDLSRRSLQTGGVTVPDELFERRLARGETRRQARFWVFGRDGAPCEACGFEIVRDEDSGRRFYRCPSCV